MLKSIKNAGAYERIIRNLGNSVYFFLPSIVQLAINLVTSPIFARNLSHWDFAVIGYFGSIQQFFIPLLNLSLFQFYMRDYHKRSDKENRQVMSSLVLFISLTGIVILLAGTGLIWIYFNLADVTFPMQPYLSFVLLSSYFNIFTSFLWIKYKMERSGRRFFILRSILIILSISLGLLFVVTFQWGAKGRLGATMLAQAAVSLLMLRSLLADFKIDFKLIRSGLKFGYPLILVALLNFPIAYIDRIFLEKQDNIIQFGLYNIGLRMAGYLFLMGQALFQAFEPDYYKYASSGNKKQLFLSMLSVFGFMFLANLVFTAFSKPIISLLTSGIYTDAYQYANIIIWSNFLLLFSFFLGIILIATYKQNQLLYLKIILAIIGFTIFSYFIRNWQFMGAAWGKVLIQFINCLLLGILIMSKKEMYQKFRMILFMHNKPWEGSGDIADDQ